MRFASATVEYASYLKSVLTAPKTQTTSFAPTINYFHGLREGLEILTFSISTINHYYNPRNELEIVTSFALTNIHCHSLKKGLKTQLVSITFTSNVSGSDIPNVTLSSIKPTKIGYSFDVNIVGVLG